jgi:hypothetical protein
MTVAELIEKLKEFDPALPVVVLDQFEEYVEVSFVEKTKKPAKYYALKDDDREWREGHCLVI